MKLIMLISDLLIPLVFILIIVYGLTKRVKVFDAFVEGAADGFKIVLKIMPTLIGLMVAVGIFRASGALGLLTGALKPVSDLMNFPSELVPIALMRTVSASATLGLVLDIFRTFGPDSTIGRMCSIMMGCTETILYTMSIYFMTVNIRKTRYTLPGALIANLAGIIASAILTYKIFP
ncbi:spore maturation protein [Vallitalea okinawensis]|uniref:spore maturation protein n=1 Tax=Vallitalea okinawensis TaxID=2078660 RepID=UPI000CFB05A0|nr:nucleoside recognition domain-containing protein [Vallitalea okinawensis]